MIHRRLAQHPAEYKSARSLRVRAGLLLLLPLFSLGHLAGAVQARNCQCTHYVYRQRPDIQPGMGDARNWIRSAAARNLPTGSFPHVGDVAVFTGGEHGFNQEFGHVAMVIGVNRSHDRFDIIGWDGIKNDCRIEIYTNLAVSENTRFIYSGDSEPRDR